MRKPSEQSDATSIDIMGDLEMHNNRPSQKWYERILRGDSDDRSNSRRVHIGSSVKRDEIEYTDGSKDVIKESVLEVSEGLKKGQKVIVLNVDRDCLGLATMTTHEYRIDRMRSNDLVAKNLADIGLYFRKYF